MCLALIHDVVNMVSEGVELAKPFLNRLALDLLVFGVLQHSLDGSEDARELHHLFVHAQDQFDLLLNEGSQIIEDDLQKGLCHTGPSIRDSTEL